MLPRRCLGQVLHRVRLRFLGWEAQDSINNSVAISKTNSRIGRVSAKTITRKIRIKWANVPQAVPTAYIRGMDKPQAILIYAERDSRRLQYSVEVLFRHILGYDYNLTFHRDEVLNCEGPLVVYGVDPMSFEKGISIRAVDLLYHRGVSPMDQDPALWGDLPVFFRTHRIYDVPFDLFAAAFYLLSRYEEYLPHATDAHGRPDPAATLRGQRDWLDIALVDRYALRLAALIQQRWPDYPQPVRPYRFVPTIDIDQMYAYRHKPPLRQFLGAMRDLSAGRLAEVGQRTRVCFFKHADPFDTYALMEHWHQAAGVRPLFFIQMGDYGGYDQAHPPTSRAFIECVLHLQGEGMVGLHPSYRSRGDVNILIKEKQTLEAQLGTAITRSRQHFLCLKLPDTLIQLHEVGIHDEYSFGYAGATGFRSGTATPHPFYDPLGDRVLPITLHPTCVMDVTLMQYLRLSPTEAVERVRKLVKEVRDVGGQMLTLWHNSSLSGHGAWQGWEGVYPAVLKEAAGND